MLDLHDVRLTKNEATQFANIMLGHFFYHANLHHRKTIFLPNGTKYNVKTIISGGKINKNIENQPKLGGIIGHAVQRDLCVDIPVYKVDEFSIDLIPFLLHSPISISESIYQKYRHVLGLRKKQIMQMNCYIRKFEVISCLVRLEGIGPPSIASKATALSVEL